jgi:hypothetical protein
MFRRRERVEVLCPLLGEWAIAVYEIKLFRRSEAKLRCSACGGVLGAGAHYVARPLEPYEPPKQGLSHRSDP